MQNLEMMLNKLSDRIEKLESTIEELKKLMQILVSKLDEINYIKRFEILKELEKDIEELVKED